jgi:peptide/nickel transport system ATP-binding protein
MALLSVTDLEVSFGPHRALRGVSFALDRGERLGIVGESGAGKSMAAFAIINLIADPGRISGGSVVFDGQRLDTMDTEALRSIRGDRIAMIFQDPMMTLNPVLTIGAQMVETLHAHRDISAAEARRIAIEKLDLVAVPSAAARFDNYPHELSGGLRQRVVIAIALLCDPEIIIADEPTTALDVTIQAEIMALLMRLCDESDMGLILITHDLAVVSESCQRLAVMYAGRMIEEGPAEAILTAPRHPYTRGLIGALPQMNTRGGLLQQIRGSMPGIDDLPEGCAFHPRCDHAISACRATVPMLEPQGAQSVACIRAGEIE